MWRTQLGERVLEGSEAELYREAVRDCIDPFADDDYSIGLPSFDSLAYPQKMAMLATVSKALLREDVPAPKLTAVLECAAAAVFHHLKNEVQAELDMAREERRDAGATWSSHWRSRIAEAVRYMQITDTPDVKCEDFEEWDVCIEALMDCIFWDRDYEGLEIEDMRPEAGSVLKRLLSISDDYFVGIAPDPRQEQVDSIRQQLREICDERGVR